MVLGKQQVVISSPALSIRVSRVHCDDIDAQTIAQWDQLEQHALEKNAYLSHRFVLPALRHLSSSSAPFIVLVFAQIAAIDRLIGVGVFEEQGPLRRFPLRRLVAYRCPHTFLTGLLVDAELAVEAVRSFFNFFCASEHGWHGVEFMNRSGDGEIDRLMQRVAAERSAVWSEYERTQRAILSPAKAGDGYLDTQFPPHRRSEFRRLRRRLEESGSVGWRARIGRDIDDATIDRMLQLEHLGWKGERGSSLKARHGHEAFFTEMMQSFAAVGHAFFTELMSNDQVIASSSNLISGDTGFAFKLGWDPSYGRAAPGLLNEIEFIRQAPTLFGELNYVDSGAEEGSFIDGLWVERRCLVSGVFATTSLGRGIGSVVKHVRAVKQRIQHHR